MAINNKEMRYYTVILIFSLFTFSSSDASAKGNENTKIYRKLFNKLEIAVAARDFKEVPTILEALMPIMKEEIKVSKKAASNLKRSGTDSVFVAQSLERYYKQIDIYASMEHLMDVSTAALRVKANIIVAQADAFRVLIDELEE